MGSRDIKNTGNTVDDEVKFYDLFFFFITN